MPKKGWPPLKKIKFCIVEDDANFRDVFASLLEKHGPVDQVGSLSQGLQYLQKQKPDILFLDLDLDLEEKAGMQLIQAAAAQKIYNVVLTSYDDSATIEQCLQLGANDYFVKGDEPSLLEDLISKYQLENQPTDQENLIPTYNQDFAEKLQWLRQQATSDLAVLLTGATGCGKTYLAEKIHQASGRKGKMISLNCSSLPKDLFESEMFGHKKGSFSGAQQDYKGKMAEAHQGTLYLDEIDSMPLALQAKLLKAIEEKQFYPVGSNQLVQSNFRLITSAQNNLPEMVEKKQFREDLYYRISFFKLQIPTLKERKEDILALLQAMLSGPRRYFFSHEFSKQVQNYNWPGNLRELKILACQLELNRRSYLDEQSLKNFFNPKEQVSLKDGLLSLEQKKMAQQIGLDGFIQTARKEIIDHFLNENSGEVNKTIKALGISSASFYRWKESSLST